MKVWLQGACSHPLSFQGHRLSCRLAGQSGLSPGDPDASALIQAERVSQLFPVVVARRAAIISLGQWWKIDSLKHSATET